MKILQIGMVFASLVLAASVAKAQEVVAAASDPMTECINSDGEWDPARKEGHRCVCTGDRIHATVAGSICEDRCVARPKKAIAAPVPAPAEETPPPAAKKVVREPAEPADDSTGGKFCRGWISRDDAINRIESWNDDIACACAVSCKSVGKLGKNPLAKWSPNNENGIFCESLDMEHYDSGVCSVIAKPGVPGLPGMSGQKGQDGADGADGAEGKPGLACWDLNGNGLFDVPNEDTDGDGKATVNDCRGAKGDDGAPGADGKSVTEDMRCQDTGGTWLTTADPPGCVCPVGFHVVGPACVINTPKTLFDRFHILGPVAYFAGSFGVMGKPVKVPFGAGVGIGLAIDLTKWLQVEARGGLFFAGDNDHPMGSFVAGGLIFWPKGYFGISLGAHGHFVGTDAVLKNRFVDVGGQAGLVFQIPTKGKVKLQIRPELLLGRALPSDAFTVGYIGQLAMSWL